MVLVSSSINNAQATNVCTYIAKGDVALSVLMSSATTLGAIFLTPLLCHELLGTIVAVNARGIASSTVQVVLAPIATGMALKKLLPNAVKFILPFAPVVGVMSTCLLVASSVAQVAPSILEAGLGLQVNVTFFIAKYTCRFFATAASPHMCMFVLQISVLLSSFFSFLFYCCMLLVLFLDM